MESGTARWLASDFVANQYDMKRLMATILTSRTYQMPSVPSQAESPKQYVFRGPEVRRITAEQFADAIGSLTGEWHVYQEPDPDPIPKSRLPTHRQSIVPKPGVYTREWRVAFHLTHTRPRTPHSRPSLFRA